MTGTIHYRCVNEILDDMIGANYAITQEQIEGIRSLCQDAQVQQRNNLRKVLNLAYEAGRQYNHEEHNRIVEEISKGVYTLAELGEK